MDITSVLREIRPCDTDRSYIFVSYSSADRELVWRDVLRFQKSGYNVWLDEKNLDKTKSSWKEDALTAIEDMDCQLVVFYVSRHSLCSEACFGEMCKTVDPDTVALHFGPVKFIAIDAEEVGDLTGFSKTVYDYIYGSECSKKEKSNQAKTLAKFSKQFFNSNNEKVRIHPKSEPNRKMDYYEEILAAFPDSARIYPPQSWQEPQDAIPPAPQPRPEPAPQVVLTQPAVQIPAVPHTPQSQPEPVSLQPAPPPAVRVQPAAHMAAPDTQPAQPAPAPLPPRILGKREKRELSGVQGVLRIPDGYTAIKKLSFGTVFGGDLMTELQLPDSIRTLNMGEFKNCSRLVSVRMPQYLAEIPSEAFAGCGALRQIQVPGGVTRIDDWAFRDCVELAAVRMPETLQELGLDVFQHCESLQSIQLPPALVRIGSSCFHGCTALQSIVLPPHLAQTGICCFQDCASLAEAYIPGALKKLPSGMFERCRSLRRVVLETGVQEIDAAFKDCGNSLEIWIPDTVRTISDTAFTGTRPMIYCSAGSYAESYAKSKRLNFQCG